MKSIYAENYNNNLLAKILANNKYATDLTKNYYNQFPVNLNFIDGEYIGKTPLQSLLNQIQCLVIVGVFGDSNNLTTVDNMIFGFANPTNCSSINELKS